MDDYLKKWLIKAAHDLKTAEIGLRQMDEDIVTDTICFHCQQAVVKFLKAFLVNNGIEFSKTHDLEMLKALCGKADRDFCDIDLGRLSEYAVAMRYPDDFYIPAIDEARRAFGHAEAIEGFIYGKLGMTEKDLAV